MKISRARTDIKTARNKLLRKRSTSNENNDIFANFITHIAFRGVHVGSTDVTDTKRCLRFEIQSDPMIRFCVWFILAYFFFIILFFFYCVFRSVLHFLWCFWFVLFITTRVVAFRANIYVFIYLYSFLLYAF